MTAALDRFSGAEYVARALFPEEATDGSDCRAETGREGEPCRICADRNHAWTRRVAQVREVIRLGGYE